MNIHCIWDARAGLGESPLWHAQDCSLYWVDIANARLYRLDPRTNQRWEWELPFAATCLVESGPAALLACSASGFYALDTRGRTIGTRIAPGTGAGIRTNDGACDPWGNLWYGTMDVAERQPLGRLHRMQSDGSTRLMWGECVITNGPTFDVERRHAFFTDTLQGCIYRVAVDCDGIVGTPEVFRRFHASEGYPDGMAVDAEGGLWCAMFSAGMVVKISPRGDVVESIALPVTQVTKCTFGGVRGRTLFVTSARRGLSAERLEWEPLAGGLFAIEMSVAGAGVSSFGRGSKENT